MCVGECQLGLCVEIWLFGEFSVLSFPPNQWGDYDLLTLGLMYYLLN